MQVPRLNPNAVQTQALPNVKFGADAPAEAFGAGQSSQNLDKAMGGIAETGMKIAVQAKDNADDAVTQEYQINASKEMNRLMWEPDKGALYQKGKNAFNIRDTYGSEYSKYLDGLDKNLSNDRQKAIAGMIRKKYEEQMGSQLDKHTGAEISAYERSTAENGVLNAREDAVLNYAQPGVVENNLKLQEAFIVNQAKKEGAAPETVAIVLGNAKSKTQSGVILKMLDDGKDEDALKYYDSVKDQLMGADDHSVSNALESAKYRGGSIKQSDEIMKMGLDMGGSLSQARKIEDPKLRDETTRRVKERFQEKKAAEDYAYQNIFEKADRIAYDKKSIDAIPVSYLSKLKPEDIETIRKRTEGSFKTDYMTYTQLKDSISNGDDSIINMSPESFYNNYRGKLDDGEYKEIVNDLEAIRKGDKTTKEKYDGYRTESQIVADTISPVFNAKSKADKEKISEFKKEYDLKIQQYKTENKKTYVPNDQAQKIADDLMKETIDPNSGWFGFFQKKSRKFEDKKRAALNPKEKEAFDWAMDNPKDPYSAAVLKKLGIK